MHISRKIICFIFWGITTMTITAFKESSPFYAMLKLVSPYDTDLGKYNIGVLILSIGISISFLCYLVQMIDEQFRMSGYILVRGKREFVFSKLIHKSWLGIVELFFVKLLVDILLSQAKGWENVFIAIGIECSTLLTVIMWSLIIYLLFQMGVNVRWIYFIMMLAIILLQYASAYLSPLSFFVFGSPDILEKPIVWIIIKITITAGIFCLNKKIYPLYEYIGNNE